ncbi:MAG: cytosine/adenosine deaminase [Planctomycetota bacterium]|nr:cytosine/adenosine deaminase [Planctomycetota bacterium]
MTDEDAMKHAIAVCREGIRRGQSPFGAAIVKEGLIVAATHNTVRSHNDPTAHAEVNVLRAASRVLATFDLTGCTLYTTCEPCPMCLAASHWAHVDRVVFGAAISDADRAGFREMPVPADELAAMGKCELKLTGKVLRDECSRLFHEWKAAGNGTPY